MRPGTSPSAWNFGSNWPHWNEIADFRSTFARTTSAVTSSEKSSINTNRKSTMRFPMSPRWTSYRTLSLSPKLVVQKRKVSKIWTISCDNSETVWDRICQLLLIINRKSHTGFRLIATSMTLNNLERRNSPYFPYISFFTEFDCFAGQLRHSVEDRPKMSVKYCLPVTVFHFWP